jgi:hypothetical protein
MSWCGVEPAQTPSYFAARFTGCGKAACKCQGPSAIPSANRLSMGRMYAEDVVTVSVCCSNAVKRVQG